MSKLIYLDTEFAYDSSYQSRKILHALVVASNELSNNDRTIICPIIDNVELLAAGAKLDSLQNKSKLLLERSDEMYVLDLGEYIKSMDNISSSVSSHIELAKAKAMPITNIEPSTNVQKALNQGLANSELQEISIRMHRAFDERQWNKFHDLKSVAASLSVEAAEVLEHLVWLRPEQMNNLPGFKVIEIQKEIADVTINVLTLARMLDMNVTKTVWEKFIEIEQRYTVDEHKGIPSKWLNNIDNKEEV